MFNHGITKHCFRFIRVLSALVVPTKRVPALSHFDAHFFSGVRTPNFRVILILCN